ncbi:MAG TPA: hypothetical protein VEK86_10675 [Gemmatimonadales bacterium]|nr:hypothetical protein [Gemmatimonadales bacterium]
MLRVLRFAFALGRFLPPCFALGRFVAFLFFFAGLAVGAAGCSLIGVGVGSGADGGYIGSIMPGPVQLLSEKSVGSSIGSPVLVVRGRGL